MFNCDFMSLNVTLNLTVVTLYVTLVTLFFIVKSVLNLGRVAIS